MKINQNTKISELIKFNKDSIDTIASLAKPLEKLKNPILRKLMASRVTIQEAASIGKSSVEAFKNALTKIGFEWEDENSNPSTNEQNNQPEWLQGLKEEDITRFDVRPILNGGEDPLKAIMAQFKEVELEKALCIINSFIPTPLITLLEKSSALSYTETISPQEYHTYFLKIDRKKAAKAANQSTKESQIFHEDETLFQENKARFLDSQIKEIDVRHLEMPGPMQTILGELEVLPADHALYVNHKRIPLYLLEEIEDKGYIIHIYKISDSEVKLLIEKNHS